MPRAPEGGQPSLPVGTLPVDGIPRDGEEYLAMVRAEAQNAPSILVHAMEAVSYTHLTLPTIYSV